MDSADGEGGDQQPLSFESTSEFMLVYRSSRKGVALNSTCTRKTEWQFNTLVDWNKDVLEVIRELRALGSFAEGNVCDLPALTKHFSGPWNVFKCGFSLSGDTSSQQDRWGWKCNQVWKSLIGSRLVPAHAVGRFQTVASGRGNFIALFVTRVNQYASSGLAMTRSPSGAHIRVIMVGKTDYICPAAWKKGHRALSFIPSTTDKSKTVCASILARTVFEKTNYLFTFCHI